MKSEFSKIYNDIVKSNIISEQYQSDFNNSPIDKVVYENDTLLFVKEFSSFSEPIWVHDLKKEIEEFKQACISICSQLDINQDFAKHLQNDERYEWSWRDQWLFLLIPGMLIKTPKNKAIEFFNSKNIKVEDPFKDI